MVGGGKDREEMSRLIDADDFEKFIKEKYKDGESTDDIKDQMLFDLSYQPTAFDTEKVVEEVKKLDLDGVSMVEDGKYTLVRRNEVISLIQTNGVCKGRQKSCKYCYKKDCPLSTEKTLSDKWSDIVKKGGVE